MGYIVVSLVKLIVKGRQMDHITIFNHHIYEYKKGLRRLVLYTGSAENREIMVERLEKNGISFHIVNVSLNKVNCFFGDLACINVIRSFGDKRLHQLSDHEDFILGTLLGYDLHQQCERYLNRLSIKELDEVA